MKTGAIILGLLLSFCLRAQEADSLSPSPETKEKDLPFIIRTVDVFAYYFASPNRNYKITVLGGDSLNDFQSFNLAEALKQGSPLFVKSYGANGIGSLNLRGTGASHTKVYWNGIDISPPGLGLMDLSLLPNDPNEFTELSYGAGALPLSSGNIGGGLHINASPFMGNPQKTNVQMGWGSFGRQQYQVSHRFGRPFQRSQTSISYQRANNNFPYLLPGETERTHTLDHAAIDQLHIKQGLFWRIKPKHYVGLKAWYNFTDREIPRIAISNQNDFDRMEDANLYLSGDWQYQIDNRQSRLQWISGFVNSSNRFYLANTEKPSRNDYRSYQSTFKYVLAHKDGPRYTRSAELSVQNRYDLVQNDAYLTKQGRLTNALYGQYKLSYTNGWEMGAQMRTELFDADLAPLTGSFNFAYKAKDLSQLQEKWKLYFNLSRNYRLPGLNDLYWQPGGNLDLAPELSHSLDMGYFQRKHIDQHTLSWELNAFWMHIANWIQWSPYQGVWQAENYQEVQNWGIEARLKYQRKFGAWQFRTGLNYNFLRSLNLGSLGVQASEGKDLPFNPNHNFNGNLQLKYKSYSIAYQANFTDRYFLDEANYYYLPSYLVQDLRIGYSAEISDHKLLLQLGINNLGNRDYQVIAWRPEPGIHYYISLVWDWEKR